MHLFYSWVSIRWAAGASPRPTIKLHDNLKFTFLIYIEIDFEAGVCYIITYKPIAEEHSL